MIFFWNSFSKTVLTVVSTLISLTTCEHGTVFLTFIITKTSSDQLGAYSLTKIFFYFGIRKETPTLTLAFLALELTLYSAHKPDLGFNLAYRHQ